MAQDHPRRAQTAPIHNPEWLLKAGFGFGAFSLLTLIGLTVLAGTVFPYFICNSFTLLAAFFAFAAALSGAFIGGGAAAQGKFGYAAINQSIEFSVGGGAALLVITFLLFLAYRPDPKACTPNNVYISFRAVPNNFMFAGLGDSFWRQDKLEFLTNEGTTLILATDEEKTATAMLMLTNGKGPDCPVTIHTEPTSAIIGPEYDRRNPFVFSGNELVFELNSKWKSVFKARQAAQENRDRCEKAKNGESCPSEVIELKELPACFIFKNGATTGRNGRAEIKALDVDGKFVVVPNEHKIFFTFPNAQLTEREPEFTTNSTLALNLFSQDAKAQTLEGSLVPFAELKKSLSDPDGNTRLSAQAYLSQHFSNYEPQVMEDLFSPNQDPDYMAGLLEGLIGGIDADSQNKLVPGRPRHLDGEIRQIKDKERDIVTMTGSSNVNLRKEARKIIQRYPIDAFDRIYTEMLETGCSKDKESNQQAIIYASIFYYYNRIVQYAFEKSLDADALQRFVDKGFKLSDCLDSPQLKIDSAALKYAKAFAYSQHKDVSSQVPAIAKEFLELAQNQGSARFYSQSQIEAATRMSNSTQ